jgi:phage FluMu gp28-like protein
VLDHAYADPLWRVHELPGPPHWIDGTRLAGERRRLPESSYRRLFLNEWAASEDRLASEDDLAACVTLDGPLDPRSGIRYAVGLDIGLRHDATVAAVCHAETIPGAAHPRIVVDRMQVWRGSRLRPVQLSAVEEWVEEAARRYGQARVRFDPFQAVHLAQRLKRKGITVEEFTFSPASVAKLASILLQLIREHAVALPDDADLLGELRNLRLRESSPGVFRLDHDRHGHDDRAVALALAASWLVERGSSMGRMRTSSALLNPPEPKERTLPDGQRQRRRGVT